MRSPRSNFEFRISNFEFQRGTVPNFSIQSGFTLLEVSIAMSLMVLVTLVLYGAFHLGQRAMEKARVRSEQSQKARLSGELLAGYVRSAYPYHISPKDPAIFFSGDEHRLTFVSALSIGMGGRGMSEVSLSWGGEATGVGDLIFEERMPVRPGGGGGGYDNGMVLRENIRGLRIEYLDPQSRDEHWVEQWDGGERKMLPRAIRLSHLGDRGETVQWVFPIMMSVLAP